MQHTTHSTKGCALPGVLSDRSCFKSLKLDSWETPAAVRGYVRNTSALATRCATPQPPTSTPSSSSTPFKNTRRAFLGVSECRCVPLGPTASMGHHEHHVMILVLSFCPTASHFKYLLSDTTQSALAVFSVMHRHLKVAFGSLRPEPRHPSQSTLGLPPPPHAWRSPYAPLFAFHSLIIHASFTGRLGPWSDEPIVFATCSLFHTLL